MDVVREFVGTWEEVRSHEEEFVGRQVRLQLMATTETPKKRLPNTILQNALQERRRLQANMKPSPAEDTVSLLRQARSGEMFGDE